MNLPEGGGPQTPVRRVGLIDQAAALLREQIATGNWPVGQRIPTEPALVKEFGIGRNTIREAIQALVHSGMLRREQGRGTFVISDSELSGTLQRQLAGGTREHYLEIRLILDTGAATRAALNRTEKDVQALRKLRDIRRESWNSGSARKRTEADLDLHNEIVRATNNPLFTKLYSSMLDVFAEHMRGETSEDENAAHEQHHELVEAIADADPARARAAVTAIFAPFMT